MLRDEGDRYTLVGSVPALTIPASLRDLLVSRLDQLTPTGKQLAHWALCWGMDFPTN